MGYYHEYNRLDIDDYIIVNFKYIDTDEHHNLRKYNGLVVSFSCVYDYRSIMHYGGLTSSRNGRHTTLKKKSSIASGLRKPWGTQLQRHQTG